MNIYEIDEAILQLISEEGEVTDFEAWEALQEERDQKIENTALLIKNLTAMAKGIREEEKTLAERRQIIENKISRAKRLIDYALQGQKFTTPKCAITWRRTRSTEIDEARVMAYLKEHHREDCLIYPEPHISRILVSRALEDGEKIDGATIVERLNPIIK